MIVVNEGDHTPCQHRWTWVDRYDLWYCPQCRRTESDDDNPPDDEGQAA